MSIPKKMKAAVLHGARDLRLESVPVPVPKENEVLIEILANGLCGSDIHFFEEGKLGPFRVTRPYIPGHEAVGRIVTADKKGKHRTGDLVVIEPGIPCGICEKCRSGRYNLCPDVVFLSAPPVNGTFSEYITIPVDMAYPLPEGVTIESGALAEPVGVAVQACRRSGLTAGQTLVITGSGPIGLITGMTARAFGAARIIMTDVNRNRLKEALKIGADTVINPESEETEKAVYRLTEGRMADVVIDASGSSQAAAITTSLAKRGGVVTLVGWPEKAVFDFPVEEIIEKELDVRGVNRYCNTFEPVLSMFKAGLLNTDPLISHRFSFDQVREAFEFVSEHRDEVIKAVISG